MEEKRYLKWYNKVGYGVGDIAGNLIFSFLMCFVMIYLTDAAGLNAGIIGTLMMVAKLLDGVTDVFFGSLIDKTHTKMGKARPWMFWGFVGNAITLIAVFAIPSGIGETAKYIYFFIMYTMLNSVFYTANNIAYASLTALVTRNGEERVQMGTIRSIFANITYLVISYVTIGAVDWLGGGAEGWKNIAIIYAVLGLITNTISVFSVKELPEEALEPQQVEGTVEEERVSLWESLKLLFSNKFYVIICLIYIVSYMNSGGVIVYYLTYILHKPNLLGAFSTAATVPMLIGTALTPWFVKLFKGMYRTNLYGYILCIVSNICFAVSAYMQNVPLMLAFTCINNFCVAPLWSDLGALIAATSDYTYRTKGKRVDGTFYSCSSLGTKIGGGIGTALTGWLLTAGGYVANAEQQSQSCINMLHFMYIWLPLIIAVVMTFLLSQLKVEQANAEWDAAHGMAQSS